MRAARGDHVFGLEPDEIVHDREIVRRQIPDDVHVMLKEPEIDSGRVVVVERAENVRVDQFLDLAHGASEQEGVIHHDLEVPALGELDQFSAWAEVAVRGFSTKTCLPFSSAVGQDRSASTRE